MGACCANPHIFPEIDEASTLDNLIVFLNEKSLDCISESKEIEDYLEDKSKIPKKIEVAYQTEDNLKKRVPYLQEYSKTLKEVSNILKNNKSIHHEDAKKEIHKLYELYFLAYDPDETHKSIPNEIRKLIK